MGRRELSGLYADDDSLLMSATERRSAKEKPGSGVANDNPEKSRAAHV